MRRAAAVLSALLLAAAAAAHAAVGLTEVQGKEGDAPVTVFYPAAGDDAIVARGPFKLRLAPGAAPARGNGRLVVLSHGSGGAPWVHADLAHTLVGAGFVVAMPEHRGDNYKDLSMAGPESWERRPAEVSRAIDAIAADARFRNLVALDKVGVYGMSAGGHTALTLAGGRWSPASFTKHCEAHIAEDFQSCVGLATHLSGGLFDGLKTRLALLVIRHRFQDAAWRTYDDPRVAAIVAAVPYAADFDKESLLEPRVPLGLVTARGDKWLIPRFHGDAVLAACKRCERIADLPGAGHGALLSPAPPLSGLAAELLGDPPGFDRQALPEVDRKITAFFVQHLR